MTRFIEISVDTFSKTGGEFLWGCLIRFLIDNMLSVFAVYRRAAHT